MTFNQKSERKREELQWNNFIFFALCEIQFSTRARTIHPARLLPTLESEALLRLWQVQQAAAIAS